MKTLLAVVVSAAFSHAAAAQVAISARLGTLGPGIEISTSVSPHLTVRAGGSLLSVTQSETFSDMEVVTRFDAQATVGAAGAFLDIHPTGGSFRLVGGAFYSLLDVSGTGTPTESYFLDEKEFLPERLGTLTVGVSYSNKIQPYLGVGFGNSTRGSRLHLLFDLGAVYTGAPELTMSGTGMIAATANWQERLNEGISSFRWYPNLSIGLGIRL